MSWLTVSSSPKLKWNWPDRSDDPRKELDDSPHFQSDASKVPSKTFDFGKWTHTLKKKKEQFQPLLVLRHFLWFSILIRNTRLWKLSLTDFIRFTCCAPIQSHSILRFFVVAAAPSVCGAIFYWENVPIHRIPLHFDDKVRCLSWEIF